MSIETVVVTGGNGRIGEAIIQELNHHGYRTVNLARGKRRENVSAQYLTTDLMNPAEVYGSLARTDADAIIHMGTLPSPTRTPGYVTFESNVNSAYYILEAATALNLESVCLPSSINAMGASFQNGPIEVQYLPIDEDHPLTPRDPYAIGKHAMEIVADGFGRRRDAPDTISSLRYPWVAHEDELVDNFVEADRTSRDGRDFAGGRNELFSYVHIDDAATIARLAIEADFSGHEVFWAVAADTTMNVPSEVLAAEAYPDADVQTEFKKTEGLISVEKAKSTLGWMPERTWRELSTEGRSNSGSS